ncbi:MAG: hypothetical protein R3200_07470 [Xanthomonadales bacterium]|nr:hypothetical protein [Xanthomonadales bacterium]
MRSARTAAITCLLLAATALAACSRAPVRTHSLYFAVQHAALFADPDGRGAYVFELRSVRKVTELSVLRVSFERPGSKPFVRELTVRAGQRRFVVHTPAFEGFRPGQEYLIRVELIAPDRYHRLDNLRHRVTPVMAPG